MLPASALAAKCYVVKGAKPLATTRVSTNIKQVASKTVDSYPPGGEQYLSDIMTEKLTGFYIVCSGAHYSKLGSGLCRGEGWQSAGFPKDVGSKTVEDCASACQNTAGCRLYS